MIGVLGEDCGCKQIADSAAEPLTQQGCGCAGATAGPSAALAMVSGRPSRRRFLGRVGLFSLAGFATRFLPVGGGKAEATTCYSWVYWGCERYCDCNCNKANMYYVYRRLCCNGGCWYEYWYRSVSTCGNYCGPCGAFLGTC